MIDTLTVARTAGQEVKRRGSRWWMCCPLHGERTASLMIDECGRWHCFGCGANGDAADLYAALYNVSLGEALRVVRGKDWHPKPRLPTVYDLKRVIDTWKAGLWEEACVKKYTARATIRKLESTQPDSEAFWQAVADDTVANDTLNCLASMTPRQALQLMDGGDEDGRSIS